MNSDLDLVRELESLRLKQRLLTESLEKKKDLGKSEQLADIASKLDFLVSIFKSATEEEQSEKEDTKEKIEELDKKFSEVLDKIDKRFDEIEAKITTLSVSSDGVKRPPVPDFDLKPDRKGLNDGGDSNEKDKGGSVVDTKSNSKGKLLSPKDDTNGSSDSGSDTKGVKKGLENKGSDGKDSSKTSGNEKGGDVKSSKKQNSGEEGEGSKGSLSSNSEGLFEEKPKGVFGKLRNGIKR